MSAMRPVILVLGATLAMGLSSLAHAETYEVKMLNRGEKGAMVFEPAFLTIAAGDTVKFVPADKGHNAESIDGMVPAGATPFQGKINEEIDVTFDTEGVYGVRCKPHFGMGMVMAVEVGAPTNLDEAKAAKLPKKAKEKFEEIFTEIAAQ